MFANLRLPTVLLAVVAIGITACTGTPASPHATAPTTAPSGPTPTKASRQTVLPFTYLDSPHGVGVDGAGNVYVGDSCPTVDVCRVRNNQVLKLAARSNTPTVLPFTGIGNLFGLAVDSAGTVYVADNENNRVLKLAAGSNTQTVLPFTGLKNPVDVAVDSAGAVYVADNRNNQVVKLAAGSNTQTVLPFTDLDGPEGVAVDTASNVYVADWGHARVVELAAG